MSEYEVTSIPEQMIVRSSELNLFLSSSAPCFLMRNYWDGGALATYLNLDANRSSFLCMTTNRTSHNTTLMLSINLINPHANLRIVVSGSIGLQSWFAYIMDSALKHNSSLRHTTEWLTSPWDPGQQEVVSMGMGVLDIQLLGWFDFAEYTGCSTLVSDCVFTEFQQTSLLILYQCLLNQAVDTHPRAKPMELFAEDNASTRCSIIIGAPNYQHRSSLRYPSDLEHCFWLAWDTCRRSLLSAWTESKNSWREE